MVSLSRKAQKWDWHFAFMTFPYLMDLREVYSCWRENRLLNTHPRQKTSPWKATVKLFQPPTSAFQVWKKGTEQGDLRCRTGSVTVSLQGWGFFFFSFHKQTKQQSCWSAALSSHAGGMRLTLKTSLFCLILAIQVSCCRGDIQILLLRSWRKTREHNWGYWNKPP